MSPFPPPFSIIALSAANAIALFRCFSRRNSSALSIARSALMRMGGDSGGNFGEGPGDDGTAAAAVDTDSSEGAGMDESWSAEGSGMGFMAWLLGGGSSDDGAPAAPTPTRLPRFFFTTFLAPMEGADHETPDPAGRDLWVTERRSEGAGAGVVVAVLVAAVAVVAAAGSEINDGGSVVLAGNDASAVVVGAGVERKENPLPIPAALPPPSSFSGTAPRLLPLPPLPLLPAAAVAVTASPFSLDSLLSALLAVLDIMEFIKLNDDPAVEVADAASTSLAVDSAEVVAAIAACGAAGVEGAERKENPLLLLLPLEGAGAGSAAPSDAAVAGCGGGAGVGADRKENPLPGADAGSEDAAVVPGGSLDVEVVNPANMDGAGAAAAAAAAPIPIQTTLPTLLLLLLPPSFVPLPPFPATRTTAPCAIFSSVRKDRRRWHRLLRSAGKVVA
mmetsp:Transcript_42375/g.88956  ORF Transcript_42375/g.88956 Transcript_42375/m.88956 type:complete len:446 (+) Transcript_42375:260-1597(+)